MCVCALGGCRVCECHSMHQWPRTSCIYSMSLGGELVKWQMMLVGRVLLLGLAEPVANMSVHKGCDQP